MFRRSSIKASPYRARTSRHPVCAFALLGASSPPLRGGEYLSFAKPALLQARIRSLHKHIGGPGPSRGTKTIGVIVRELGGFHLFDRCDLVDHCLNAIADGFEHYPVFLHLAPIP